MIIEHKKDEHELTVKKLRGAKTKTLTVPKLHVVHTVLRGAVV